MRKLKTALKNRTNYVYYVAEGTNLVVKPGLDGVTEEWITILHMFDDMEVDANRREIYRCPIRFESYCDDTGMESRNPLFKDSTYDPLEMLLALVTKEEYCSRVANLREAISKLTNLQKSTLYKKYFLKKSNVDIASEEGVSEAAIRNRLNKIYIQLRKKI